MRIRQNDIRRKALTAIRNYRNDAQAKVEEWNKIADTINQKPVYPTIKQEYTLTD